MGRAVPGSGWAILRKGIRRLDSGPLLPLRQYVPAMSILRHKYTIEWAKTGQRKDDPSKEVIADDYRAAGDFFVFVQRHSNAPNDYTTVLTVRANDVASIEVGERIER